MYIYLYINGVLRDVMEHAGQIQTHGNICIISKQLWIHIYANLYIYFFSNV
jgi:hypothetical protein